MRKKQEKNTKCFGRLSNKAIPFKRRQPGEAKEEEKINKKKGA